MKRLRLPVIDCGYNIIVAGRNWVKICTSKTAALRQFTRSIRAMNHIGSKARNNSLFKIIDYVINILLKVVGFNG